MRIVDLYRTNLDVGYINEPEDSDYRKIASWRLAYSYIDVSDDELLQEWCAKYDGWEYLYKAIAKKNLSESGTVKTQGNSADYIIYAHY